MSEFDSDVVQALDREKISQEVRRAAKSAALAKQEETDSIWAEKLDGVVAPALEQVAASLIARGRTAGVRRDVFAPGDRAQEIKLTVDLGRRENPATLTFRHRAGGVSIDSTGRARAHREEHKDARDIDGTLVGRVVREFLTVAFPPTA